MDGVKIIFGIVASLLLMQPLVAAQADFLQKTDIDNITFPVDQDKNKNKNRKVNKDLFELQFNNNFNEKFNLQKIMQFQLSDNLSVKLAKVKVRPLQLEAGELAAGPGTAQRGYGFAFKYNF